MSLGGRFCGGPPHHRWGESSSRLPYGFGVGLGDGVGDGVGAEVVESNAELDGLGFGVPIGEPDGDTCVEPGTGLFEGVAAGVTTAEGAGEPVRVSVAGASEAGATPRIATISSL